MARFAQAPVRGPLTVKLLPLHTPYVVKNRFLDPVVADGRPLSVRRKERCLDRSEEQRKMVRLQAWEAVARPLGEASAQFALRKIAFEVHDLVPHVEAHRARQFRVGCGLFDGLLLLVVPGHGLPHARRRGLAVGVRVLENGPVVDRARGDSDKNRPSLPAFDGVDVPVHVLGEQRDILGRQKGAFIVVPVVDRLKCSQNVGLPHRFFFLMTRPKKTPSTNDHRYMKSIYLR